MKRVYILLFTILAMLFVQCKRADNNSLVQDEKVDYTMGSELKGKFTIFAFNSKSNISSSINRLNINRLNIINYYINGISYNYSNDGTIRLQSESTLTNDSYRLSGSKREMLEFNGNELLLERGTIDYRSSFSGSGLKVETALELKSIEKNFSSHYNKLLTKAVRESAQEGSQGIIYPVGELSLRIEDSSLILTAGFLIFKN